ncbi:MAG: glycoside hydrolase family 18 protein [Oscillospiraceae bacterium]
MKTMRKIISIAGVLLILTGILSSCGTKKQEVKKQEFISFTTGDEAKNKILSDGKMKKSVSVEKGQEFILDLGEEKSFDTILLDEIGDNVNWFKISVFDGGAWKIVYEQDRILKHHTCYIEPTKSQKIKIEITDCKAPVELCEISVYSANKSEKPFKVSQYLRFDKENMTEFFKDIEGSSGYYDVVTDVILFATISMNEKAELVFVDGEETFAKILKDFREVLGERNPHLWGTVFLKVKDAQGNSSHDITSDFVMKNSDKIKATLKTFVEKYNLYGIDYDWEYPESKKQWKAYDKLVTETASITKVAVALPPWGIGFSKDAIKAIEHINVMTYDLFDERFDHCNSFIGGIDSIERLRKAGFNDEQILLGIPTYGRTTDKSGNAWPVYRNNPQLGKWGNKIKDFPYKDEDGNQKICDGYLDSFAEARDKTALSVDSGIGGVMIFRAMCDAPYTYEYSIHRAIKEVVDTRVVEKK